MLRVLIADDHRIIRRAVRSVIEDHPGWVVCAEATDGQQALDLALREAPDVAVLDVSLPVLNGVAVAFLMQRTCPKVRVMMFTMHDDEEVVRTAVAAGAMGYVGKCDPGASLEAAILALSTDRTYFPRPGAP
jgi:DNA-binding NarL/FixJ family response regulator